MKQDLRFDMALSYCSEDGWAARDLSELVSQQGFSVYSYDYAADKAGGFLRNNLSDIYKDSRLNIILWSVDYNQKQDNTLVDMERRVIINRHVHKGEDQSLIIVTMDDTPLHRDLEDILAHNLKKEGVTGIAHILVSRLKKIYMTVQSTGSVYHPLDTDPARGVLHPCTFCISDNYKSDPHRRWTRLADVLVDLSNSLGTANVYLIPSGLANPLVRHTIMLKNDPRLLEYKRRATEIFIEQNRGRRLAGLWFPMRIGDAEVATVYSEEYDRFLNRSLQEFVVTASLAG